MKTMSQKSSDNLLPQATIYHSIDLDYKGVM